jgi:antitoxin component HigA of HigAB toxin-antitoxin module
MIKVEAKRTTGEANYLGSLTVLIHHYETCRIPLDAMDKAPLSRLKFLMRESGATASDLQEILQCSQSLVSLILNGKRELSKANIRQLAGHFKIRAGYFI